MNSTTIIIPAPNHYHRFPFDLFGHGGGRRAEGRIPKVSNIPISNTQKGCRRHKSNHMHWEMTRNRARRARLGLLGPFSMSAAKHMSAAPRALRRPAAESLPFWLWIAGVSQNRSAHNNQSRRAKAFQHAMNPVRDVAMLSLFLKTLLTPIFRHGPRKLTSCWRGRCGG